VGAIHLYNMKRFKKFKAVALFSILITAISMTGAVSAQQLPDDFEHDNESLYTLDDSVTGSNPSFDIQNSIVASGGYASYISTENGVNVVYNRNYSSTYSPNDFTVYVRGTADTSNNPTVLVRFIEGTTRAINLNMGLPGSGNNLDVNGERLLYDVDTNRWYEVEFNNIDYDNNVIGSINVDGTEKATNVGFENPVNGFNYYNIRNDAGSGYNEIWVDADTFPTDSKIEINSIKTNPKTLTRDKTYTVNATASENASYLEIDSIKVNGTTKWSNIGMSEYNNIWVSDQNFTVENQGVEHLINVTAYDSSDSLKDWSSITRITEYNPTEFRYYDNGFNNTNLVEFADFRQDMEVWGNISENTTESIEIYTVVRTEADNAVILNRTYDLKGSGFLTNRLDVSGADFNVSFTFDGGFIDSKYYGQNFTMRHKVRKFDGNGNLIEIETFGYTEHGSDSSNYSLISGIVDGISSALGVVIQPIIDILDATITPILNAIIEAIVAIVTPIINGVSFAIGYLQTFIQLTVYDFNNHGLVVMGEYNESVNNTVSWTFYNYNNSGANTSKDYGDKWLRNIIEGTYNVTYTASEWREENDKTLENIKEESQNLLARVGVIRTYSVDWINSTLENKTVKPNSEDKTLYNMTYYTKGFSSIQDGWEGRFRTGDSFGYYELYADYDEGDFRQHGFNMTDQFVVDEENEMFNFFMDSTYDGRSYGFIFEVQAGYNDVEKWSWTYVGAGKDQIKVNMTERNDGRYNITVYGLNSESAQFSHDTGNGILNISRGTVQDNMSFKFEVDHTRDDFVLSSWKLYNYTTSLGVTGDYNTYYINNYGISLEDAPEGVSRAILGALAILGFIGGIFGFVFDIIPDPVVEIFYSVFNTLGTIVNTVVMWYTAMLNILEYVFVKGSEIVKWGLISYGVVKGAKYWEVINDDSRTMVDGLHYIGKDLERTAMNFIDLVEKSTNFSVQVSRFILDLVRTIKDAIKWW